MNGGRIDHFGAKMRKLHGFGIAHALNSQCFFHLCGIGRHKAVHIGPYLESLHTQGCRYNGSRVIRSAPAQRGGFVVLAAADKTGYYTGLFVVFELGPDQPVAQCEVDPCIAKGAIGLDKPLRIDHFSITDDPADDV